MVYQFIHERRISALDQSTRRGSPWIWHVFQSVQHAFPHVLSAYTAAINVARSDARQRLKYVQEGHKSTFPPIYI